MKKLFVLAFAIFLNSTIMVLNSEAQSGWTVQTNSLGTNLTSVHILNNGYGYASGYNGNVFKTSNYGVNWNSIYTFNSYILYGIKFANKDTGYCVYNYAISQTKNGGLNWYGYTPSMTSTTFYCLAIGDTNHIYAGGNSTIYLNPPYPNYGMLTRVESYFNGGLNHQMDQKYPLAMSFINPLTGYITGGYSSVTSSGFLNKTIDGGLNISSLPGSFPNTPNAIFFINLNTGWIAGANGFIRKTTNGGYNWVAENSMIPGTIKSLFFLDSLTGWFCAQNGVIKKTTSGGDVWGTQTSSVTSSLNCIYFINPSTGYVCGDNGTILKTTDAGGITSTSEINNQLPSDHRLEQNYPNPFNPTTNIKYAIAKSGLVTLKVYDVMGREVETLINGKMNAGKYESMFNGENLTSGIYFYKLITEGFTETKRMMFIK